MLFIQSIRPVLKRGYHLYSSWENGCDWQIK